MKKLVMALAVILAAAASYGEVMYWQVSNPMNTNAKDYTMARVRVYTGNATDGYTSVGYLNVIDESDGSSYAGGIATSENTGGFFDFGTYAVESPVYSFALELVNDNLQIMGSTLGEHGAGAKTYSELKDLGVVANFDSISPLNYSAWNAGFVDIPEPTSGLMLLLGASLLALRRKRS